MDTHRDADFNREWMDKLEKKANVMRAAGQSEITGGKPGEKPLHEWEHGRVYVRQMPDDEHGLLRISLGGGDTPLGADYCTYRGDRLQCITLLRRALKAMERPL